MTTSSGSLLSVVPLSRERRIRRQRVSALLVIGAIASSALVLQAFHDQNRNSFPGTPAAFTYFPN
jgi:hypothetical protein